MRGMFNGGIEALQKRIDPLMYKMFAVLPVTRFAHEPKNAKTYRSQVIWEEAVRRGIPMEQMIFLGTHTEIYRARVGDTWQYFQSLPVPPHLEYPSYDWIDDKFELKRVLRAAGVPTPRIASVTTVQGAIEALQALPEQATIDDAIERLCFIAKVEARLRQSDAGQLVPHDEVKKQSN